LRATESSKCPSSLDRAAILVAASGKSDADRKVEELARALGGEAIKTLASIMRSAKAPASARSAAAQAILDRGFGRPRQTNDVTVINEFENLTDDELRKRILEDAAELGLYSAVTLPTLD
jgi:hypothetical protein